MLLPMVVIRGASSDFRNVGGDKTVAVLVNADNMIAHAVVARNGTAGNGVFQPAQKTVYVLDLNFCLGNVADVAVAAAFYAPDDDAAFRIAETRNALGQIFSVVLMQAGAVFSGRNGLFKIQKQFLGLQIDDKIVNGVFPEINQLLKNIFGAGHVFSPRNLKTVFLFYRVYMINLNFVIMLFQFGQQAFNQFLGS